MVVLVPIADAASPIARFAFAPSAPKLIPAMVIGIARSSSGRRAKRAPMVTEVSHFSR